MKVTATIFMPTTTPQQKISQVKFFGGEEVSVKLIGDTFDASAKAAKEYAQANSQAFIDPFDNINIIAGQGTVAAEIFNEAKKSEFQVDYLFAAIGGGGLISGVSTYTKAVSPTTAVIGVEPLGAQSMRAAFNEGKPVMLESVEKFVDGAAVKQVGELTYAHTLEYVDQLLAVDEGQVCTTILELYTKQAIVVEPAGALSVSGLELMKDDIKGKNVVCIISGGNNDINRMEEIEERSLIFEGLKHYFVINFPQRPGALREFVTDILGPDDDITRFEYTKKVNRGTGPVILATAPSNEVTADQQQLQKSIEENKKLADQRKAEEKARNEGEISESTEQSNSVTEANYDLTSEEIKKAQSMEITAFGDSVILDAAAGLQEIFPKMLVDGEVGRQLYTSAPAIQQLEKDKVLKDNVLVGLGTNGSFTEAQFDEFMAAIGPERKVYWVNVRVPTRRWQNEVNTMLENMKKKYNNLVVIDWYDYSNEHEEWFYDDRVHPNVEGQDVYQCEYPDSRLIEPQ
ncbi:hypothetical protein HW555_014347 [Spodoptera exigua]|uniref:threonine ammonia-lyase n=1 Tax=Spodoptera exigua TaxID=7107 RepID=A0A835G3X9_SPOEX|nr:hypothetical protein HW555_014347 [Spodoptera exigua]